MAEKKTVKIDDEKFDAGQQHIALLFRNGREQDVYAYGALAPDAEPDAEERRPDEEKSGEDEGEFHVLKEEDISHIPFQN